MVVDASNCAVQDVHVRAANTKAHHTLSEGNPCPDVSEVYVPLMKQTQMLQTVEACQATIVSMKLKADPFSGPAWL